MRRALFAAAGTCLVAIAGCFAAVSLDGLPCPCADGFQCVEGACKPAEPDAPVGDGASGDDMTDARSQDHDGGDASVAGDGSADSSPAEDSESVADADAGSASNYPDVVLADKPLAYWRLDEDGGTVAHDFSGNGNDATYSDGGVVFGFAGALANSPDPAVRLTGGSLSAGTNFPFAVEASLSIEFWMYPYSLTTGFQRLVSREDPDAGASRAGYLIYARAVADSGTNPDMNTLSFERWLDGGHAPFPTTSTVGLQAWHYVVATYDATQSPKKGCMYLDAVATCYTPSGAPIDLPSAAYPFFVGKGTDVPAGSSSSFDGAIDEVAIYSYALTSMQVGAHYVASGR